MKLFLYSHTHWDREWYLSQNQFQYRLIHTIDEVIETIEADNGFETFVLDGQTSILQDYLELRPEREPTLRRLIEAGHLIIGPWYTMPDLFLPDGESLIRNLHFGARDCADYKVPYPNVGYVPDSFGHIEQLPQIMQRVGIDNYLFGRGQPVTIRDNPDMRREFHWKAPDGSTVLGVFLPDSYISGRWLPPADEPERLRARMESIIHKFQESTHAPDRILIPHGIDHCWLQKDIPGILAKLNELYDGQAAIHHGTLEAFVDSLKEALNDKEIGTYSGQLRGHLKIWELHGTLSSRVDTKIKNEWAQIHLESLAEPLEALSSLHGKDNLPAHLEKAWEKLLQNHAHDSICGCSQDRVHDDVNIRFREVIETGIDIADGALDYLNNNAMRDGIPTVIVFGGLNGGNRLVDFVIRLAEKPGPRGCLRNPNGQDLAVQWGKMLHMKTAYTNGDPAAGDLSVTYYECHGTVFVEDLSPCEVRQLTWVEEGAGGGGSTDAKASSFALRAAEDKVADRLEAGDRNLENRYLRLQILDNGTLELEDKENGFVLRNLNGFAHDTDIGGGYHHEQLKRSKRRTSEQAKAQSRLIESGPLRATLEVSVSLRVPAGVDRETGRLKGKKTLTMISRYTLEAESKMVRVTTSLNNETTHQRIRATFPSGSNDILVHADAAFAVHDNAMDRWPFEGEHNFHPMRSWCALQAESGGLGILTRGLHEYEITRDAAGNQGLEITLLRSVDFVQLCSTWETPKAQLPGEHTFEYALIPFAGDWRNAELPGMAAVFRAPAIANTHGDVPLKPHAGRDSFAITGYLELKEGRGVFRDTNRSSWKRIHSQRDGWKRIDRDRFVQTELPRQIVPFTLKGEHLSISAFKRSRDGQGWILRLWSWHDQEQSISIRTKIPGSRLFEADLLEKPKQEIKSNGDTFTLTIKPFEILTLRLNPTTDGHK